VTADNISGCHGVPAGVGSTAEAGLNGEMSAVARPRVSGEDDAHAPIGAFAFGGWAGGMPGFFNSLSPAQGCTGIPRSGRCLQHGASQSARARRKQVRETGRASLPAVGAILAAAGCGHGDTL
jgi:hypothetical protein